MMNTRGGEGKLDRFNFRVNLRKIEISLSLSEVRGGRRTRRLNKEITNAFDWAESKKEKERRKYFWTDLYSHVATRTIDATQHSDRSHRSRSSDPRLATQGGKSDPLLPRTWMPGVCISYVCITCNAHNIHFLQGDHGEHACENSCARNCTRAVTYARINLFFLR